MTAQNADGYNNPPPNYNLYPLQATPNEQNPRILPTINPYIGFQDPAGGSGEVMAALSPAQYLVQFPRVAASATVTFTGSVTTGDSAYVAIQCPLFTQGEILVGTVVSASDTLAIVAERLATFANQNPQLSQYGITASYSVVSSNPTITLNWPGPISNLATLTAASIVSSDTLTIGGSVASGGGDVLTLTVASPAFASNSAEIQLTGSATQGDVISVVVSNPALANTQQTVSITVAATPTLASIASQIATALNGAMALDVIGIDAVAQNNNVWITFNAAQAGYTSFALSATRPATETIALAYNQSVGTGLQPLPAPTQLITINGSATQYDVITILINAPYLFGWNPVQIQYTVGATPTTSTVATGIAALINAQSQLVAAGFVAVAATNVVTVTWNANSGVIGFSAKAAGAPTEIVTLVAPVTSVGLTYTTAASDTTTIIATAFKNLINANPALIASGFESTSSGAVVSMFGASVLGPITYTGLVSVGSETMTFANVGSADTITVGGSATLYDKLNVIFTAAELPGGAHTVTTLVPSGSASTTVQAAAIAASINQDSVLADIEITATSASAVVTLVYGPNAIVPVVTESVTSATETITVTGTPTAGDQLTITVKNPDVYEGSQTVNYTVLSTDTSNTILAASLTTALNALIDFTTAGFVATSSSNVISIVYSGILPTTWSKTNSTNTTLTLAAGSTTETLTVSQGAGSETFTVTQFAGGTGPIIPTQNFPFSCSNTPVSTSSDGAGNMVQFFAGQPTNVAYQTLEALVNQQMPVI